MISQEQWFRLRRWLYTILLIHGAFTISGTLVAADIPFWIGIPWGLSWLFLFRIMVQRETTQEEWNQVFDHLTKTLIQDGPRLRGRADCQNERPTIPRPCTEPSGQPTREARG